MSSFIRSVVTGACALASVFTLSAATNLVTDGASKRTITMVQGKVVGGSLGNAFNGKDDWAAAYGLFSASTEGNVVPSPETPIVFDFTFNDDYRPGEDLGVTRFTVSGINNYYNGGNKTPNYYSSVPSDFTISGSLDGETWTELVSSTGYTAPTHLIIPYAKRAPYRRFRFTFTKNAGYSGSDHGTLFIQNIAIYADSVYYAKVDGSDANDGLSWATATSLTNGFAKANAAVYNELHLQVGTYLPSKCLTATKMMTIVGGLAGEGDEPDAVTGRSVIDAQGAYGTIFSNGTSPGNYSYGFFTCLENLDLRHATAQAVSYTTTYGSFRAINCRFAGNRGSRSGSNGIHEGARGLSYSGYNGGNMRCELYGCEFVDNGALAGSDLTLKWSGCGCSISYGTAVLENCLFASNGLASADMPTSSGTEGMTGHAISSSAKILATGCRFVRNRGTTGWNNKWPGAAGGATVYSTASGNVFDRCIFVANENVYGGSVRGTLGTLTVTANTTVRNCTFAYNLVDGGAAAGGLTVNGGTAAVTNSIFYGNAVGSGATVGADIHVAAAASLKIGHSLVSSAASLTSADATHLDASEGVLYDNPRFVTDGETAAACRASSGYLRYDPAQEATVANFDVHLLTPAGYRKNGDEAWCTESDFTSPAIDAGEGDYTNEPVPNGGVRNLGYYGNTEEASKSAEKPHFAIGEIPVQFYDGVNPCRPVPPVVDLDSGAALTPAEVQEKFEFKYANNAGFGTGLVTLTGADGSGYDGQSVSAEFTISASFRVTNDATDGGTGMSWSSPMTLAAALAAATRPTDVILMKAGTYPLAASVVVANPVTIRGGYAGTDDVTLADDPESVLDGQDSLAAAVLSVTANASANDLVTVERLALVRGQRRGLLKTGAASLVMRSCRIEHNRYSVSENIVGIGASVSGTAGATTVRFVDCRVADNCDVFGGWKDCRGHGMAFSNLKEVQLIGCAFVSNGIPLSAGYGTTYSFSYQQRGFAVYATSVPIVASNCEFRANRGLSASANESNTSYQFGGIVSLEGNGHGTSFSHCLFAGNQSICPGGKWLAGPYDGAVYANFDTTARTAAFDFCTFLANLSDGRGSSAALNLRKGAFTVGNSVFAHNVVGTYAGVGADVHLAAGTLDVSNTIFGGKGEGWVSAAAEGATISGLDAEGVQYGDALTVSTGDEVLSLLAGTAEKAFPKSVSPVYFVNSSAADVAKFVNLDAHLLSAEGYRRNGSDAWFTDTTQVSPAIDAADEDAPYENEPDPNGERANLGFYGNTDEAAKTASGTVEIPNDVDVAYPDGYSQPKISFTLGGEGAYSATIVVTVSTNGVAVYDEKLVGKANGDPVEVLVPYYLNTGAQMDVHVDALTAGGSASQDYAKTVTAPEPPWIGKKGPPNVIHVRPGATGKNDGTSWTDAFADFHAALAQLAATDGKDELWLAGTNVCSAPLVSVSFSKPVAIRGGFDGHECAADERYAGARGAVDGNLKYATLAFANGAAAPVTVERVDFLRSSDAGVVKSGAGALTMTDCDIVECGHKVQVRNGYGLSASGTAGTTVLKLVNCRFEANGIPHKRLGVESFHDAGVGFGAHLSGVLADLEDCSFVANGVPFDQPTDYTPGWRGMSASALYADTSTVRAKDCRFVANRAYSGGTNGGAVLLGSGTDGSVFENCLWCGNENQPSTYNSYTDGGGAALRVECGAAGTVDVVNCTFAANLTDVRTVSAAGVNVRSGTVNVKNCVFGGNLVGRMMTGGATDLFVAAGATANVTYSIFPSAAGFGAAEGGVTNIGAGVIYGDARFASPVSPLKYMVQYTGYENAYFTLGSLDFFKAFNVHLRGKKGYFDETLNREVKWPENSPAIDAGDPASSCGSEPHPNGHRVNMGFYGNTAYATKCARSGLAIVIDGGLAPTPPPKPKEHKFPVEDVVVCDQADQAIKIYHGTDCVWTWSDSKYNGNVAECKPLNGNRWIGVAVNNGRWCIIDRGTKELVTYGTTPGMPHSIELLPNDIVAVAATDTSGDQVNKGVYLFDISGGGEAKNRTKFSVDNPHGLYWDAAAKRLYVTDTYRLNRCTVGYAGGEFSLAVEASWAIAPLGLTYAHDLMHVPGTTQLVMTTYEKVIYFDMEKEAWVPEKAFYCSDTKCADPAPDGWKLLLSIPQTSWITDTVIVYTPEYGFEDYVTIPGAKMYKARWCPPAE